MGEQAKLEKEALEDENRIHGMLDTVRRDKKAVGRMSVIPMLPMVVETVCRTTL